MPVRRTGSEKKDRKETDCSVSSETPKMSPIEVADQLEKQKPRQKNHLTWWYSNLWSTDSLSALARVRTQEKSSKRTLGLSAKEML